MTVVWKKDYDPSRLAEYIEADKTKVQSGGVKFEAVRFREYEVLLCSMLDFREPIPEVDARGLVHDAMLKTAKRGTVTANALLEDVNRLEKRYSARPLKRYVMVTSLSLWRFASLPRCRFGSTVIIFEHEAPAPYRETAMELAEHARRYLVADPPADYLSARVHVSARAEFQAAEVALEALNLARGVWNWHYNVQRLARESGGERLPVNQIVLGPVHTLHHPGGELATNTWWYETGYCGPVPVYNPSSEVQRIYRFLASVRNRLARCRYPGTMRQAIVRYASALDLQDWDAAFLKLWSVLELLTDSGRKASDVTIRRTAFVYRDREYALQILKHLRDHRNRFVHADQTDGRIETCLYQMKNSVEALLSFHLRSKYRFESIQEAAEFLDLPANRKVMESRLKLMKYAHRFRGYE